MQTLIDKNAALEKEVKSLESKITELVAKKPVRKQDKKSKGKFKTLKGLKNMFGSGNDKYNEVVDTIHSLILQEKFDDAEEVITANKKLLVKKNKQKYAPYDLQDEFGETVLLKAIKAGNFPLIHALLSRGVSVDITDDEGETPLMIASKYGQLEIVQALVKTSNRDAKTMYTKKTALHYAAEFNNLDVIKELLSFGSDPRLEDAEGRTPEQVTTDPKVAASLRNYQTQLDNPEAELEKIEDTAPVSNIADILGDGKPRSYSDDEEMKPYLETHARLTKRKQLLELQYADLRKRRLPADKSHQLAKLRGLDDKEKKDFLGVEDTAELIKQYHNLVLKGDQPGALEEVENLLNKHGKWSAKKGVENLDKDAADEFGETALMKACRLGYEDMVAFLLLYKCNSDLRDMEGQTALMKAAQFGKIGVCQKLIEEGAELNASTRKGKHTALMLAAQRGHTDVCKLLISEGADYNLKDSSGKQAVDLALNPDAKEVIENSMQENPLKQKPVVI